MFKVVTPSGYWLRGTTWTLDKSRASVYSTQDAAKEAIRNSMRFTKPVLFRRQHGNPQVVAVVI